MSAKLIALGNNFLDDICVAPKVAKYLEKELGNLNIEVILEETDLTHYIQGIQENDIIFILDTRMSNKISETVTLVPLNETNNYNELSSYQHQASLIRYIGKFKKSISSYLIGIDPNGADFSNKLNSVVNHQSKHICDEVISLIKILIY